MKVLLVSPYSENIVGGIINWTKYIVNYHRVSGRDVELLLLDNKGVSKNSGANNPLLRFCAGLRNHLPTIRSFKKTIKRENIDVVHISSSASLCLLRDIILLKESRKKGIRSVMHMHFGRIPSILHTSGWEHYLLIKVLRQTDHIIVMDKASRDALHEAGFDKVSFVPNPLSDEVQEVIKRKGSTNRNPRKIVYAGHIVFTKGVSELVKACSQIGNIQLELLGQIPVSGTKETLYEMAGTGAKRWLHIPGAKPFEEVIESMLGCSIFALPSYTEGFPNVILESMACGCAIVSTPVGAIPEMLNSDSNTPCGVIVPIQDVDKLRDALIELLDNPEKVKRLGENARERVIAEYTISSVWSQLVQVWTSLCHKIH